MTPAIRREISNLKRDVQRLKPARGPFLLTQQTTRGVIRRPSAKTSTTGMSGEARWS